MVGEAIEGGRSSVLRLLNVNVLSAGSPVPIRISVPRCLSQPCFRLSDELYEFTIFWLKDSGSDARRSMDSSYWSSIVSLSFQYRRQRYELMPAIELGRRVAQFFTHPRKRHIIRNSSGT